MLLQPHYSHLWEPPGVAAVAAHHPHSSMHTDGQVGGFLGVVQGHVATYGARLMLLRLSLCSAVAHALASRRTVASLQQVAQVTQAIAHAWEQARAAEEQAAADKEELYKTKSSEQIEEVRPAAPHAICSHAVWVVHGRQGRIGGRCNSDVACAHLCVWACRQVSVCVCSCVCV